MTDRISLGALWEESVAFIRAEAALLFPVACLGFGAPLVMLMLAIPADQVQSGRLATGPWLLWLVPAALLAMTGSLAISALTLRPGATVGDCLRLAVTRLPAGLGLVGLNIALQIVLALPIVLLAQIDIWRGGEAGALAMLGNVAALGVMIWLYVRVLPVWAVLATRGGGPVAALRECFAITHGRYRRLLLLRVVAAVAAVVTMLVLFVPLSVAIGLVGVVTAAMTGTPLQSFPTLDHALSILSYVAIGLVVAMLGGAWTVYVAKLYRVLGSSSGI
jgi:hypothetical protein